MYIVSHFLEINALFANDRKSYIKICRIYVSTNSLSRYEQKGNQLLENKTTTLEIKTKTMRYSRFDHTKNVNLSASPQYNLLTMGFALQVLAVDIKKDCLINYVRDTAKKVNQADRLERAIITINEPSELP